MVEVLILIKILAIKLKGIIVYRFRTIDAISRGKWWYIANIISNISFNIPMKEIFHSIILKKVLTDTIVVILERWDRVDYLEMEQKKEMVLKDKTLSGFQRSFLIWLKSISNNIQKRLTLILPQLCFLIDFWKWLPVWNSNSW